MLQSVWPCTDVVCPYPRRAGGRPLSPISLAHYTHSRAPFTVDAGPQSCVLGLCTYTPNTNIHTHTWLSLSTALSRHVEEGPPWLSPLQLSFTFLLTSSTNQDPTCHCTRPFPLPPPHGRGHDGLLLTRGTTVVVVIAGPDFGPSVPQQAVPTHRDVTQQP